MKDIVKNLCVACALLLGCGVIDSVWAGDGDSLKDLAKTTTTETFNLSTDGEITGRTVATDTIIVLRSMVVEVYSVDSNGLEYVASRKTQTYDSVNHGAQPIKTVIEESSGNGEELIETSITTVSKSSSGSMTVYETIDDKTGILVISKRVTTGFDEEGRFVTTIEGRGKDGNMNVVTTTVKSTD